MKQRKPSLVQLTPHPISFSPLGFLPLSLAEVGRLRELRERGDTLFSLPPYRLFVALSGVFQPICFARVPICTQTQAYTFLHAHTPTADIYPRTYTHSEGDLGPPESWSGSFLPCPCISINKPTTPAPFPTKTAMRRGRTATPWELSPAPPYTLAPQNKSRGRCVATLGSSLAVVQHSSSRLSSKLLSPSRKDPKHLHGFCTFRLLGALFSAPQPWAPHSSFQHPSSPPGKP